MYCAVYRFRIGLIGAVMPLRLVQPFIYPVASLFDRVAQHLPKQIGHALRGLNGGDHQQIAVHI